VYINAPGSGEYLLLEPFGNVKKVTAYGLAGNVYSFYNTTSILEINCEIAPLNNADCSTAELEVLYSVNGTTQNKIISHSFEVKSIVENNEVVEKSLMVFKDKIVENNPITVYTIRFLSPCDQIDPLVVEYGNEIGSGKIIPLGNRASIKAKFAAEFYNASPTLFAFSEPSSSLRLEYTSISSKLGIDGREDWVDGDEWIPKFYVKDHLGSTRIVLNAEENGFTREEATWYYSYGNMSPLQVSGEQYRDKFTGKEFDQIDVSGGENGALGFGLHYLGARYYNSELALFISQDPAEQSYNLYSYCLDNPINFNDPSGEIAQAVFSSVAEQAAYVSRALELKNLSLATFNAIMSEPGKIITQNILDLNISTLMDAGYRISFGAEIGASFIRNLGTISKVLNEIGDINDLFWETLDEHQGEIISIAPLGSIISTEKNLVNIESKIFGSGPKSGFIEVSSDMKSPNAVNNFSGKKPVDFIFDSQSERYIQGNNPFGHDGILNAGKITPNSSTVGGTIFRQNGVLITNEHSGHYGVNWTDAIRAKFNEFMKTQGVNQTHILDF
jgi:RHS repeat-associated protein